MMARELIGQILERMPDYVIDVYQLSAPRRGHWLAADSGDVSRRAFAGLARLLSDLQQHLHTRKLEGAAVAGGMAHPAGTSTPVARCFNATPRKPTGSTPPSTRRADRGPRYHAFCTTTVAR